MKLRFFDLLLRLYPKDHREMFGAEMANVLRQASHDRRREGIAAYLWFTFFEIAGLLAGAVALQAATLAGHRRIKPVLWIPAASTVEETELLIQRSIDCMVHAIATHQFVKARFYSEVERKLRQRLQDLTGELPH
jgi:hypothetical protein